MLKKFLDEKEEFVNNKIRNFLPESFTPSMYEHLFPEFYYPRILNGILHPVWELLSRGGKRWRPVLMMLCCDVVGGGAKIEELIPLVELIHNGTLMIDDVEDNSDLRRGKPSIHKLYGVDVAINSGNLIYFLPFHIVKHLDVDKKTKLMIYEIVHEEMINLHLGQGTDIYMSSREDELREDVYFKMCAYKTGTLARMSARLGALFGEASKVQIRRLARFAEVIGIAFQIQDDILNISSQSWGKTYGEDISEGKKSLMVIYTLQKASEEDGKRLLEILSLKTKDHSLIIEAINILHKYDSILYAQEKAKSLVRSAWNEIDSCLEDSLSKERLRLFADYLINRDI